MLIRTAITGSWLLVACSSSATTPHKTLANVNASRGVRIAVAAYDTLSLIDLMPSGSHAVRSAKLATRIDTVAWLQNDPIVLLQRGSLDNCGLPEDVSPDHATYEAANRNCIADGRHDGTIGRLTATGFVPTASGCSPPTAPITATSGPTRVSTCRVLPR